MRAHPTLELNAKGAEGLCRFLFLPTELFRSGLDLAGCVFVVQRTNGGGSRRILASSGPGRASGMHDERKPASVPLDSKYTPYLSEHLGAPPPTPESYLGAKAGGGAPHTHHLGWFVAGQEEIPLAQIKVIRAFIVQGSPLSFTK